MWKTVKHYIGLCLERTYPYILALIVCFLCHYFKINITNNSNFKELLNGLVTLASLIIGFLGAIMPVLVSMKNESAFVKYIFENDSKHLFSEYMKTTLFLGILDTVFSLIMHVRGSFSPNLQGLLYYIWIALTISFLTATYRSMSHMISLVFSNYTDTFQKKDSSGVTISSEESTDLHNRYRSK